MNYQDVLDRLGNPAPRSHYAPNAESHERQAQTARYEDAGRQKTEEAGFRPLQLTERNSLRLGANSPRLLRNSYNSSASDLHRHDGRQSGTGAAGQRCPNSPKLNASSGDIEGRARPAQRSSCFVQGQSRFSPIADIMSKYASPARRQGFEQSKAYLPTVSHFSAEDKENADRKRPGDYQPGRA